MLQELLVGVVEERKTSIPGGLLPDPSSSPSHTSSVAVQSQSLASSSPAAGERPQQNLRCPRCNSSNTKFCYYNNYNLTQPRHFCKTCRRYWTKGGALRNVPIGGGCRKAKMMPSNVTSAGIGSKSATKTKAALPDLLGRLDQEFHPAWPVLWASSPTSQIMALLRATTNVENPNPNTNSVRIKDDGTVLSVRMAPEPPPAIFNGRGLSLDPLVHLPFGSTSVWKNSSQCSYHHQQQQPLLGHAMPASLDFHQKLKLSTNEHELQTLMVNNVGSLASSSYSSSSSTITASSVMEPIAITPSLGEFGSWADLPAINGAFS